jgi:hypothetical protein
LNYYLFSPNYDTSCTLTQRYFMTDRKGCNIVRKDRVWGGGAGWWHVCPQLLCTSCSPPPDLTCFPPPVRIVRYGASTCIMSCCEASLSHPAPFSNDVLNEGLLPYQKIHCQLPAVFREWLIILLMSVCVHVECDVWWILIECWD